MNFCRAGHKSHDKKKVNTILGEMTIYDWKKYMGFNGYCTGQDGVSQTIEQTGSWDIKVHDKISELLDSGNKEFLFIDVGSHIGYFSRLASLKGYRSIAYEGDPENVRLFEKNVIDGMIISTWFEDNDNYTKLNERVEVLKIDIEGSEQHAIRFFKPLLEMKYVNNIIIEVSPIFNGSYPKLISELIDFGFEVFELDDSDFDFNYNFEQRDLWLKLTS